MQEIYLFIIIVILSVIQKKRLSGTKWNITMFSFGFEITLGGIAIIFYRCCQNFSNGILTIEKLPFSINSINRFFATSFIYDATVVFFLTGLLLIQSNSYSSLNNVYFKWSKIQIVFPINFLSSIIFFFTLLPIIPILTLNWMFYVVSLIYFIVIARSPITTKESRFPIIGISAALVLSRLFLSVDKQAESFALFGLSCLYGLVESLLDPERKSQGVRPPLGFW